ncbi:MFS transporter [Streptococcus acidominimus]|uniref:MFS transporter n=1 Tax=Streptococcus acidominimus TaxID=1326 RepID=A0A4Y9FTA0_STRAI|nr:MFS transporter [Streptococcus acidominimus]MBF0818183.1 MFS transporter [Streptococcus acidominimus]MBF0838500.1 MFS transporter [Streptococcus acidominimus]MBF0848462.1 MFS transporter [Streptococcus danieliae]TFU31488.1 MFS transporter [Streptococcus acidominimus]
MKKIMQNRLFILSFVADMVSNFGDVLYYLALMNYVLILPDTKLALSMITLSETLPILVGFFIGMWADKTRNKLDTIVGTLVIRILFYSIVGLIMGFSPALWIVAVACLINLLSDLAGQYESSLFMPVSLRVISNEDREAASAFRQGIGAVLRIVFQSSGAVLIGVMTYQQLAFFNAGTFLVSLLITLSIRPALQKLLLANPLRQEVKKDKASNLLLDMKKSLVDSYQAVQGIPVLKAVILVLTVLNALFVALSPVLILSMKEMPSFAILNPTMTIAANSIIYLVGSILGSLLTTSLFKDVSIARLTKWVVYLPIFIFVSFYFRFIHGVFIFSFVTAVLAGVANPKISALIYRALPENQLATISAGIATFFQLGMLVTQGLVAVLVVMCSARTISFIFFLLSLALLVYTRRNVASDIENDTQ